MDVLDEVWSAQLFPVLSLPPRRDTWTTTCCRQLGFAFADFRRPGQPSFLCLHNSLCSGGLQRAPVHEMNSNLSCNADFPWLDAAKVRLRSLDPNGLR